MNSWWKFLLSAVLLAGGTAQSQELYIATDPASNMPAKALGFRLNYKGMESPSRIMSRYQAEVRAGITKKLMVMGSVGCSDYYQLKTQYEGLQIGAQYRIFTIDKVHQHLRGALWARYSHSLNPQHMSDLNLYGDHSGISLGGTLTQLIHKVAVSTSWGWNRVYYSQKESGFDQGRSISGSLSIGALAYPLQYNSSFKKTNVNLYAEFLGGWNSGFEGAVGPHPVQNGHWIDLQPAIQFIFNSQTRLDLAYRFELDANVRRMGPNMVMLRLEHLLFQAW